MPTRRACSTKCRRHRGVRACSCEAEGEPGVRGPRGAGDAPRRGLTQGERGGGLAAAALARSPEVVARRGQLGGLPAEDASVTVM